jgi:hypothetical protein
MKKRFAILLLRLSGLVLFLFSFPLLAETARMETVRIGEASIHYTRPEGFVRADGLFPLDLSELDETFGLKTIVFAQFIPETDRDIREKNPRAVPGWYAHLACDDLFFRHSLNNAGFSVTTFLVEKVVAGQYRQPEFLMKLERLIGNTLGRKLDIRAMTQKGFVEKEPGYRSMLAYGHGVLEADEVDAKDVEDAAAETFIMASLTTFYLTEGKLITLLQASRISSEADLPAFTQKALRIAAEIFGRERQPSEGRLQESGKVTGENGRKK